ncbi:MAG TPA: DUF5666 domain-containing protein [Dehalococcoidia bacterium]|nr:DUF5666 domain-containing protein [Dehalococcoidia bacterium]
MELEAGQRTTILHLSNSTLIWDGSWVAEPPIQIGDKVHAIGKPRQDGSLDAEKLYVNPVNYIGVVVELRGGPAAPITFEMHDRYDSRRGAAGPHQVRIDPRTTIVLPDGQRRELGNERVPVQAGQSVQVVGRKLSNGTVLAALFYPDA